MFGYWLLWIWSKFMDRRPSKVIDIELFKDADAAWRWRLRAANHEVLAVSEAYSSRSKAEQTAKLIRSADYEIRTDGLPAETKPKPSKRPKFPL
jgi:uncharacterized protein YegP (UPF0339 family)